MKKDSSAYQKLFRATLATTMATGVLVAAVPTYTEAAKSFTDVKPVDHFNEAVSNLVERGIIKGYDDGTFRPNENISRAHAAKVMALALELDTENVIDPGFKDIPKSHPYYGHIAALVNAGIINGYEDNTFRPTGKLTRAHAAQMLVIGYDLEEELSNLPFKDINDKQWSTSYIQTLYAKEITTGTTETTFSPNTFVTRGQVASFINRSEKVAQKKGAKVIRIADNKIELSDGTFLLHADLQKVFNAENLDVLKGAKVKYTVKKGVIVAVSSIELHANGTARKNLTLDGQNATFAGDITVNGDYIALKNLEVPNVTVTTKAKHVIIDAEVDELHVKTKNSKITLGTDAKIGNLVFPRGIPTKDIVQDYDNVKEQIEKINGQPDQGSPDGSTSKGNAELRDQLRDQLEKGNEAADGAVKIKLAGKKFKVEIKDPASTLDEFSVAAEEVFDAFKANGTVVNSATVTYRTSLGKVTLAKDDINNNQDFDEVIKKALAKVGLSGSTKLSILENRSIEFKVKGVIDGKAFDDKYTFEFKTK
ncbi:S-layer homology domain-containing protein [Sporosarcina soli]|uniref:S-layer homology domain-containing protein n=1 Tax=Sporosarcina soli TaxID=334736 RepID=A0ABW0TI45_9BACL